MELWKVEDGIYKVLCAEEVEQRDIKSGEKVFKVLANSTEVKIGESGEDCARQGRRYLERAK